MSGDTITNQGERVVIFNDSSPPYRLIRISQEDIANVSEGRINPHYEYDFTLPLGVMPSEIRLVCSIPFGEGVKAYVGRVSPYKERGFYIDAAELVEAGEWRNPPETCFIPLDSRYNKIRLEVECKKTPEDGLLFLLVDFRYLTKT